MHWGPSIDGLESLVASSAKFQDIVGAANAEAAKAFIHYGGTPDVDEGAERPWAIIDPDRFEDQPAISWSGSLVLSLDLPKSRYEQATRKERFRAAVADFDTVIEEMKQNSADRVVLWNLTKVIPVVPPWLVEGPDSEEGIEFYTASYMIEWT